MKIPGDNSLSGRVYNYILDLILSGELPPGEAVNELEIAQACSASRTPVRQALKRLENEGLVIIHTNRHTEVVQPEGEMVRYLGEARILFDWLTARLAMYYGSDADFYRLRQLARDYEEMAESGKLRDIIEADARFHMEIARMSGNEIVGDFLRELFLKIGLMQTRRYHDKEYAKKQGHNHLEIVELLASRDSGRIKEGMLAHLVEFYNLDQAYDRDFFL